MAGSIYLLDTNILSEPAKPEPDASVMALLKKHCKVLCSASLVFHAMYYGIYKLPESKLKRNLQRYLRSLKEHGLFVLPYDQNAAKWHARERARLAKKGQTPAFVDGQIAAIAKQNDMVLVTRNQQDFKVFKTLRVGNWFD